MKLKKIRRFVRVVRTVRTENDDHGSYGPYELKMAITDRTNRTVREKDLRIVNKAFQLVKESVCD